MDTHRTRQITDGRFSDVSPMPTDIWTTTYINDGHFSSQKNVQSIFHKLDASHNGHFPD